MKIPKLSLAYKIREKTITINTKMLYGYKKLSKEKMAEALLLMERVERIISNK